MAGLMKNSGVTLDFIKQMSIDFLNVKFTWSINNFTIDQNLILSKLSTYFWNVFPTMQIFWPGFTIWTPVPELSMMSNAISDQIYNNFNQLLHEFDQPWHRPVLLQEYSWRIHEKEALLIKLFRFYRWGVRPICRPGVNQRILYNGYKSVHSIKFQSVVIPNGLISNLFGPYEGQKTRQ